MPNRDDYKYKYITEADGTLPGASFRDQTEDFLNALDTDISGADGDASAAMQKATDALAAAEAAQGAVATLDQNCLHKSGNETATGTKTFTVSPVIPTQSATDNSTKAVNSAWVRQQNYLQRFDVAGPVAVYYVDAMLGDDSNDGLSELTAFQTLAPIWQAYNTGEAAVYQIVLKTGAITQDAPNGLVYDVDPSIYAIWQGAPHFSTYGPNGAATLHFHSTRQLGAHFYSSRVSIGGAKATVDGIVTIDRRIRITGDKLDISPEGMDCRGFFFEHCASSIAHVDFLIPVKFVGGRVGIVDCTFYRQNGITSPFDKKRTPTVFFEGMQVKLSSASMLTDDPYAIGFYFKNCDATIGNIQEAEQTYQSSDTSVEDPNDTPIADNDNEEENIPSTEPTRYPLLYAVKSVVWYCPRSSPVWTAASRHIRFLKNYQGLAMLSPEAKTALDAGYYSASDEGYVRNGGMQYVDGYPYPGMIHTKYAELTNSSPLRMGMPGVTIGTTPATEGNIRVCFADQSLSSSNSSRIGTIISRVSVAGDVSLRLTAHKFSNPSSVATLGVFSLDDGVNYGMAPSTPQTGNGYDIVTRNYINDTVNGTFSIRAYDSSTTKTLLGSNGGTLTWDGQAIQISSDERLKTQIETVPDTVLDAWGDVGWGQFQFLEAVAVKGDSARLHCGMIAQKVKTAFENRGLDACRYGILCHETRPAREWDEHIIEKEAVIDDDTGEVISPEISHTAHRHEDAMDLWMVRYSEALAMEAAYQRRRADRLEARIAAIEAALAAK